MKKPIQILFDRHRQTEPQLDRLRETVIGTIKGVTVGALSRSQESPTALVSIRHWLLSLRWHLAGIGAVWILVALLNLDPSTESTDGIAMASKPGSGELLAAWRENRRQVLQLMDLPGAEETPPAPANTPQRRGELITTNTIA